MATPKKPVKKKPVPKSAGTKKAEQTVDPKEKKRIIDDDEEEEDYDMPLEELGGYESFEGYEEDEEY